ncbi:MAG: hypothetical protein JWN40_1327 [Phycisphaerales bacterium]|nr:hypothetical protein [Phycisphaerales bacterium]
MQKTLDLPEELVRRLERRAAHDGRTPEQVAADLLAAGLPPDAAASTGPAGIVPKHLPLIKARPAAPADVKMSGQASADWLKDVDLQLEVERYEKAFGHQHVDRADR